MSNQNNINNAVSIPRVHKIWDVIYAVYSIIALFPFIHDLIICPVFNIGIRGGDGNACGFGWFWLILAPFIIGGILIWVVFTIIMFKRALKIRKLYGSVWRIFLYAVLFLLLLAPILFLLFFTSDFGF